MEKNNHPTLFFKSGPSTFLKALAPFLLATTLMVIDHQYSHLKSVRTIINTSLRAFHHLFFIPRDGFFWMTKYLSSQTSLCQQIDSLQTLNLQLTASAMRENRLFNEINQLRELLGLRKNLTLITTPVEVLHDFHSQNIRKVMIDQGSQKGIIEGSCVITKDGLVGQVTRVYKNQSEVTLITDRSSTIPIENSRTGTRAILQGRSSILPPEILYQLPSSDIKIGDQLITSGLDQYYPSGIPVANVIHIEKNANSTFAKILVKPIASVDTFIFALVIQPKALLSEPINRPNDKK